MYHKIRITVASLAVMSICLISSAGTLSYFTDSDSKSNDFVVGNASTNLIIYNDQAGGSDHVFNASDYKLVDGYAVRDCETADSPCTAVDNIPFYPQAENNGNIPVYQRFRVVVPIVLRDVLSLALPCDLPDVDDTGKSTCENDNYSITYNQSVSVDDTPTYAEYYIVGKAALGMGRTTAAWPVTAIEIGNLSTVANLAENMTCESGDENTNNCSLGIKTYSDVIQTTGFSDANSAFTGFAETYN
ncbi:hypothetical protein IJ118_01810 [Candidatus Saccharibacteria bacterium]|nr:hypothetical protein [Candidatus Saccharibacteria bacterium]